MNLIIVGGTVLSMGSKGIIRDGMIVVEEDRIIDIGKRDDLKRKYRRYEKINAQDSVIIPGLINTHHHAAMSVLRGYADDLDLKTWLEEWIWPIEKHMTNKEIYQGALLTAIESVLGGTTTINTMYHHTDQCGEALAFSQAGVRGVIGHVCFSWRNEEDRRALKSLAEDWHNKDDGRIRVSVDPHSSYTVDPEYMQELRSISRTLNAEYAQRGSPIIWHTHIAETLDETDKIRQNFKTSVPGGVVEYLDGLGVLSSDIVAAHCVHLEGRDIQILKERQVKVSHCPISNMKLASGVSPVPELVKQGVTVSLGTDSSCSNNSSDMFEVMKTTALLHKGVSRDATVLPADQILNMATLNGAKALSWSEEIGSLEIGKKADIAIINFKKPHLTPVFNEVSHIVYSAKSSDVETVIIDGKIVMENRELTSVDADKVMLQAEEAKQRLLKRASESL